MSLIDDLARLREVQGKEPLPNPHVIAGFGPDDAPPPPYLPQQRLAEPQNDPVPDEFLDSGPPDDVPPPSPLIPRRPPAATKLVPHEPTGAPLPTLVVLDHVGAWKGREVVLSDADERTIRSVVLKAIQREVQADLRVAGVRRVRKVKPAPEVPVAAPRKRGRPRKVQP